MPSSSLSLSLSSSSMDSSASSVYKRMMLPAIMVLMLSANAVQAQLQTCGTNRIVTMDYDIVGNDFQVQQNVGSVCECSTVCTRTPGCFIFSYSSGNRRCTVKRITTEANFLTIHMSAPSVEISGHLRSNIIVGTQSEAPTKAACINRCQTTNNCRFITVQSTTTGRVNCNMYGVDTNTGGRISLMAGTVQQQPPVVVSPPQPSPNSPPPPSNPPPSNPPPSNPPPSNPPPANSPVPPANSPVAPGTPSPSGNQSPSDPSQQPNNPPIATTDVVTATTIDTQVTITDSTGAVVTTIRRITIAPSTAVGTRNLTTTDGVSTESALGVSPTDTPPSGSSGPTLGEGITTKGGIIGLSIAAIVSVAAILFGVFYAMKKRRQKKEEGGGYAKWGEGEGYNPTYAAGSAGGVKLTAFGAAGTMSSLPSASTASTMSPRAPVITTLERDVMGPFATSPPSPVQTFVSVPDSTVVATGAASAAVSVVSTTSATSQPVVIPKYTKAFTLEQYLAAGWTMEQIDIVKPPIAPSKKRSTTNIS